jgi:ATP-binding cassette subfamily C protein
VLAVGAYLAILQEITPGVMIAASIITARAIAPVEQAVGQWRPLLSARQAYRRLEGLLAITVPDKPTMPIPTPTNSLDVIGLAVTAPGSQAMLVKNAQFSARAGDAIGIIGPSGSGKSSLARALVGIWPPVKGSVRLDGAELVQWPSDVLGQSIGYLPQEVSLFEGTVAENIARFDPNADADDIIAAASGAGAHELVLSLPDGYATYLGVGGISLSAGQKQRIGLARALYGDPFLLVMDEPNANLDSVGDQALAQAVANAKERGAVVVIIAHRPSALAKVDLVLVMNGGMQMSFGPRDEVLQKATVVPLEGAA